MDRVDESTMGNNENDNGGEEAFFDLLTKSLKAVKAGKINIEMEGQPALNIDVDKERENKINIDFIHPRIIHQLLETESGSESENSKPGLFDKLKTAKEFAQKLTDIGLTMSFLRNGIEAIILGKDAHPTLSKLITRSDDIQVDSVREYAKLGSELKKKDKNKKNKE
jgi:hypothetical protein